MRTFALPPALLAALVGAFVVLGPLSTTEAHDIGPEREVLVQVFPSHIDVMVAYTEAPGERTDLFRARYGLTLEADPGGLLQELAGRAILPRVLDGLEFEVEGQKPRAGRPEIKIDDDSERLQVATYVRYELDELREDQRRTMTVRAQDRPFTTTETLIYAGDDMKRVSIDENPDRPPPPRRGSVELHRGDEHSITFERQ